MKKLIPMLLILSLLLTLCACGKKEKAPVPAEEPAPAEPTPDANPVHAASGSDLEPIELPASDSNLVPVELPASDSDLTPAPQAAYPMIIPMGDSVKADLDGDGTEELVCVSLEKTPDGQDRVRLTLNDVDFTDSIYVEGETWFDSPDTGYWAITDVYSVDNLLEIAIQDYGPSDDYYTNFFRYEQGAVYFFGGVEGLIWNDWTQSSDLSFEEDGFVRSYMRLRVLQTWFADVRYDIAPRGVLDVVPEELYFTSHPTEVTVKKDLYAYDGKDGEEFIVDAGVKMTVEATDNAEWIYCKSCTADWALWFRLNPDNPFEIKTLDGYLPVQDALDGLCFAD